MRFRSNFGNDRSKKTDFLPGVCFCFDRYCIRKQVMSRWLATAAAPGDEQTDDNVATPIRRKASHVNQGRSAEFIHTRDLY